MEVPAVPHLSQWRDVLQECVGIAFPLPAIAGNAFHIFPEWVEYLDILG